MILGLIPARQGSTGVVGKNMVDLGGRPLLDYTLAMAHQCQALDKIILSTNMPDAIAWTKAHYSRIDVPFVRPEPLARAQSSLVDVVLHAVAHLNIEIDAIVLLQPTSPFRRMGEVENAIQLFQQKKIQSLIGVSRVWHHPSDYIALNSKASDRFYYVLRDPSWKRRQDFPEVFFMTGALYICRLEFLQKTRSFYDENSYLFQMSDETMIDIDSSFDLMIAKGLLAAGGFVPDFEFLSHAN